MNILSENLKAIGVKQGDTILMHSSFRAVGRCVGAEEFLNGINDYLGAEGTLILPAFTYNSVTRENPVFDARYAEPCVGYLPRVFRTLAGVHRSAHPTHSVSARGALAKELTQTHINDTTPVGENSPIRRLADIGGKILFLGNVTNNNTFMHGMEEIAGAPWCLRKEPIEYTITDENGSTVKKNMYPHDFAGIAQCYRRACEEFDVSRGDILGAPSTLINAETLMKRSLEIMKKDIYHFVDRL